MSQALIGHGSTFEVGLGSPPAYTALAEVMSISGPSLARDAVDVTHMQSPEAWREFIAGLKDGGEVGLELNFVPGNATTTLLKSLFDTDRVETYRITWPDSPNTLFVFSGICTGYTMEASVDAKMSASVTFKVSGEPTFT